MPQFPHLCAQALKQQTSLGTHSGSRICKRLVPARMSCSRALGKCL